MSVRIRMKRMGRRHRPYFRIVAMDSRSQRDGRVLEWLGTYDPMIRDTDSRVTLKASRVKRWLSHGAQPTEKVGILLKKYLEKWQEIEDGKAEPPSGSKKTTATPPPPPAPKAKAEEKPAEEATEEATEEAKAPEEAPETTTEAEG